MRTLSKIGAIAAAMLGAAINGSIAAQPPVEAFGSLPFMRDPQISPDGKHFAVIQSISGRPAVVIYTLNAAPNEKLYVIAPADWVVSGTQWLKNDRLAVLIKVNQKFGVETRLMYTWDRAVSVDLTGNNEILLLKDAVDFTYNLGTDYIVDRNIDDPNDIFMSVYEYADMRSPGEQASDSKNGHADRNLSRPVLYRIDPHTGKRSRVLAGTYNTREWYMDGHGHVLARMDQTEHPLREQVLALDGDSWRPVTDYDATADKGAGILGTSDEGTALVRYVRNAGGTDVLNRVDLKSGTESTLFSNPKYDAGTPVFDPWTDRVIGTTYIDDKAEIQYFDPKLEALQKGLESAFPDVAVGAVSWNTALDRVIVTVDSPKKPIDYYYLDRTTHAATKIGSAYPDLHAPDLGSVQAYPYKARDGLDIPAYITLPPGKAVSKLPLIVMPHGGPDARDDIRFDWMAQFFANRGYIVLQPNYRGSWGYGRKFTEAGLHQWGLKMEDDLTDGVNKLVADGMVDPKRVCIVGASYGGYAALAGAALTPDVYACAVSFAGVSDLPKMIGQERVRNGKDSREVSFWTSRIGSTYEDSGQLDATSPARQASKIKCPVLLLHGEGDTTVPIEQSEIMADAMKSAGKPVEFIRFAGEDHYMNLADTRIRFLKETEAFLKKNIGN
jgi:dipeptidyl aminopeptidase/acylaminoacyl peptidase